MTKITIDEVKALFCSLEGDNSSVHTPAEFTTLSEFDLRCAAPSIAELCVRQAEELEALKRQLHISIQDFVAWRNAEGE